MAGLYLHDEESKLCVANTGQAVGMAIRRLVL
jgi:hypothetical protein